MRYELFLCTHHERHKDVKERNTYGDLKKTSLKAVIEYIMLIILWEVHRQLPHSITEPSLWCEFAFPEKNYSTDCKSNDSTAWSFFCILLVISNGLQNFFFNIWICHNILIFRSSFSWSSSSVSCAFQSEMKIENWSKYKKLSHMNSSIVCI